MNKEFIQINNGYFAIQGSPLMTIPSLSPAAPPYEPFLLLYSAFEKSKISILLFLCNWIFHNQLVASFTVDGSVFHAKSSLHIQLTLASIPTFTAKKIDCRMHTLKEELLSYAGYSFNPDSKKRHYSKALYRKSKI